MELDVLNPHVMKIIISARGEDSINAISKRIKLSYGWTHKWVEELTHIGVFEKTRSKLILNDDNPFYTRVLDFVKENFREDVSFHYSVLSLFGVKYCFTKTDAVFIWTNGGYNIARYKDHYPVFIKLRREDEQIFGYYCKKLSLGAKPAKGIFYSAELMDDFKVVYHKGVPVDRLEDAIGFMKGNIYNFEPALEMIQKMYKKDVGVKYAEVTGYV